MTIPSVLVDAQNAAQILPDIIAQVSRADFIGLDCETQDDNRHDGLNQYCGYDPVKRTKPKTRPLVFDWHRTVMTGFSVYPEGAEAAYYVNLAHADRENRLPWSVARAILDARKPGAFFLAHNAPFELAAFRSCHKLEIADIVCTMQMLVSCYGPDEYSLAEFIGAGQGGIARLVYALIGASRGWAQGQEMSPELSGLVSKIISKSSEAEHSYNGFVKAITYGYGLKRAVKSHFGHRMTTFEEALQGKAHMGELTGEQVVAYGAEDAYWAVRLFRHTLGMMARNCPEAIKTFFEQENPMIHTFADIWTKGMRVNTEAIHARRDAERERMADILRRMKAAARGLLPFEPEPCKGMLEAGEAWYEKNHARYRAGLEAWLISPDHGDAYAQCQQVRGPVSNAWAAERGQPESQGVNLAHYMPMRTLLYDLLGAKLVRSEGKVQSDGEARGKIKTKFERRLRRDDLRAAERSRLEAGVRVLDCLNEIASVEQAMKLYLTPYTLLMDPDTGRLYPVVSSELATRRMASRFPNPMQLAKRGETKYVRGFFLADADDEVIVSIDWSAIELVDIGEKSGDPEFLRAFGQLPHADLHTGSAVAILQVEAPRLTEAMFKGLKTVETWEAWADGLDDFRRLQVNLKGEPLLPRAAAGYWRTEVGKGSNFNYWYSGWLATIGERMGWDQERTREATDRYRDRFPVAEAWRLETIRKVQADGYIVLPDGHRRTRFEATDTWHRFFLQKFLMNRQGFEGFDNAIRYIAAKIQKRAYNQAVNAMIQGSCATLAKRSQIRVDRKIKEEGFKARFLMPIHDELLWSVHRREVVEFIEMARGVMITHPDLYRNCALDASPAIGLTFEPWHDEKAPIGQIELFEAPKIPTVAAERVGKRMTADEIRASVDYLFDLRDNQRKLAA